jgi:drug/metabolite transporter (DMT)-like permease
MQTSAPPPSRAALILAFAAIYLAWGSTYLGIRVAVETMPPFLMASTRFLLAGGLLFSFLKLRGAPTPTRFQWRANVVIGIFLLLGGNGLVVWAEQVIPSGITALLIGVSPLFIVLTEWAWPGGGRPTPLTLFALLLGFAGVTWLAAPWESVAQGGLNPGGIAAILVACISWAIGSIYSRHAKHGADPFMASAVQMLGGGGALLITALAHGDFARLDLARITPAAWGAFAYLVSIGSLVGFSTFVWLMKHSTPARVSTYAYVNPVVAVFLGWWLLDEPLGARTLVASAIIVASVATITIEKPSAREVISRGRRGAHAPHGRRTARRFVPTRRPVCRTIYRLRAESELSVTPGAAFSPLMSSPTPHHGDVIHSESFLRSLMRRQLALSITCAATFLVALIALPLLNYFRPALMATRVAGFTLTWLILGVLFFPFVWIISWIFIQRSIALEDDEVRAAKEGRKS